MYSKNIKRRLDGIIGELFPYSINKRIKIDEWIFIQGEREPIEVKIGFSWDRKEFPVWFEKDIELPFIDGDEKYYLEMWFGGESLVIIDNKPYGEINQFHKWLDVSRLCDGKKHNIKIQAVPKGLFGSNEFNPEFNKCYGIRIDYEIYKIILTLNTYTELFASTDNEVLAERIKYYLEKAFSMIHIPRDTSNYMNSVLDNDSIINQVNSVWEAEEFTVSEGYKLSDEDRNSFLIAYEYFTAKMKELKEEYPGDGKIGLGGHAHIDYAWLWPYAETKRKITRTFSNAVTMADNFDDFIFIQSSAQMYKDTKENNPELYKKIKELVESGRWETVGGMWVESDCNVPSAESLIRQFYYGQNYFRKEFGTQSRVCWLPDVFGFSWILPQILKEAEIDYFVTTKLTWSEKNKFPHDYCIWKGIDGSEVRYFSFHNPNDGYNGVINPDTILKTWKNHRQKDIFSKTYLSFGYGDGGGGPNDLMYEKYEILKDAPGFPKLEMIKLEDFLIKDDVKEGEIPVWDDELYLELHRGTLTSQARTKKLHKDSEDILYNIEFFAAAANLFGNIEYPHKKIDELWQTTLKTEFHDVLPGSSIKEVYQDAEKDLKNVLTAGEEIITESLKAVSSEKEDVISIINTASYEKPLIFTADTEGRRVFTSDGKELKMQRTSYGEYIYEAEEIIKPFSSKVLYLKERKMQKEVKEDWINILENKYLKVIVNENGSINIFDKINRREVFRGEGNILAIYKDVPVYWDAWDVDYDFEKYETIVKAKNIRLIESGEVRKVVRVTYETEGSKIIQDYILNNQSRLDIKTTIEWHSRRTMLRAKFPVNIVTRKALCDLSAGYIERNTHRNTDYDRAKFEVPAHRWIDLSEYNYGVSIINTGKYGYSFRENNVSINLLRSPVYPDFTADEGNHEFVYSIYIHKGNDIKEVQKQSETVNKDLIVLKNREIESDSFIKTENDALKVTAFKINENGEIVIRVIETLGSRGKTKITLKNKILRGWKGNILEDKKDEIIIIDNSIEFDFEPFKIYTFIIEK